MRKLVEVGSFVNPTMHIRRELIDTKKFAELFMGCGLVLNEDICWIPVYGMHMSLCEKIVGIEGTRGP